MVKIEAVGQEGAVPGCFLALPYALHAGNPWWTPRPVEDTVKLLDTACSPFWKQADRELFVAVKEGKVVGRIAATDDRQVGREDGAGYFGFFESIDDQAVADALLAAAAGWLRERGRRLMRGPFCPSPYIYDLGLLVDGFDRRQSFSEPYSPPYYQELLESRGLAKLADYLSLDLPGRQPNGVLKDSVRRRLQSNPALRVRTFDPGRIERDIGIATEMLNSTYESDSIYAADSLEVERFALESLAPFGDWSLCFIAEMGGEPAGIMITSPNYDELYGRPSGDATPGIGGASIVELAIGARFQNTLAATALLYAFWDAVIAKGYEYNKACFVHEDNQACLSLIATFGGVAAKRFRIYETALSNLV
jgi:ribosomal protein S18 acetylase RimI-like enzyme